MLPSSEPSSGAGEGVVFIVASHREPAQVARLVRRLKNDLPSSRVVVHHDQSKSSLGRSMLPADGVDLIEDSVEVRWGDASQVRATMRCLEFAEISYPDFQWAVLLSGQDYPIRHLGSLPAALAAMDDGQLHVEPPDIAEPLRYELTWFRLPQALQTAAMRALFERLIYHFNARQKFMRFASGRVGCSIGLKLPSPMPKGWRSYQGSNWWALSRRAVDAVLHISRKKKSFYRWFLTQSIIPDEGFFQTVLLNSAGLRFHNTDIRYIRWDDRNSGSPATLVVEDLSELERSERFFARKFDSDVDSAVLDALDRLGHS